MSFEEMWAALAPIGRIPSTGGYDRLPWTSTERELRAWFDAAATARGLRLQEDGFGNVVAWWEPPPTSAEGSPRSAEGSPRSAERSPGSAERSPRSAEESLGWPEPAGTPAVLTGSHLDSVADGGAYDGPLGVVSALAAIDLLRARGVTPTRRLGVAVFAAAEGSRFGVACLGSRLAAGALAWETARELRDPAGVALADLVPGGGALLDDVGRFVELHIEQGRSLAVPVGQATGIWPHGRWRFEFRGEGNHAGATAMADRRDPMLSYAMTALAANKQARLLGARGTFGRVAVSPNSSDAIPTSVTAWLDARAASEAELTTYVEELAGQARARAERDGTTLTLTRESVSGAVRFAPLDGLAGVPSHAGHDAGVLAASGIESSMLLVRNATGISHAPGESASLADCLAGVEALARVLEGLLR